MKPFRRSLDSSFIAFSTANAHAYSTSETRTVVTLANDRINPLFAATIQATEEERLRLSRDLHDGLGPGAHARGTTPTWIAMIPPAVRT